MKTLVNMTLSIPEQLHKEMAVHTEIKWSDIARQAFEKKVTELHWMDKVLEKSTLTEKDAEEIGHKIKRELRKRFQ
ncbi:MAG TPA: hypothetical protein VJB66_01320 [Candidatus Nanoarchaeia archaeon]|nr:hypothetical protein [Candidatus Nanoarchaeia archaeon]